MNRNDIYIVWHRKHGKAAAEAIAGYLEGKGRSVFYSAGNNAADGNAAMTALEQSANIIIAAPPGMLTLRGGKNQFRDEVRAALEQQKRDPENRTVILVLSPDTELPPAEKLPADLQELLALPRISLKDSSPSKQELLLILKAVSAVNRCNLWNAALRASGAGGIDAAETGSEVSPEAVSIPDVLRQQEGAVYLGGLDRPSAAAVLKAIINTAVGDKAYDSTAQIPLCIDLSEAPATDGKLYDATGSSFILRAVYRLIRPDLTVKQVPDRLAEEVEKVFSADPAEAAIPVTDALSGTSPAPGFLLLLDGLDAVSEKEIRGFSVRSRIVREIQWILSHYPAVRIILAGEAETKPSALADLASIDLSGFTPEQPPAEPEPDAAADSGITKGAGNESESIPESEQDEDDGEDTKQAAGIESDENIEKALSDEGVSESDKQPSDEAEEEAEDEDEDEEKSGEKPSDEADDEDETDDEAEESEEDSLSPAKCVSWSPNGTLFAAGYDDGSLRILNAEAGVQASEKNHNQDDLDIILTELALFECELDGHEEEIESVSWNPEGTRLASASEDGTVRIWDIQTKECLLTLDGHEEEVADVSWSPNGNFIASASEDSTVRIWDAETGECLHLLEGHDDEVESVSWSPDGKRVASGSEDGTVKIWDAASGKNLKTLEGHEDEVECVRWSPDGKRILSASGDCMIRIWNPNTGKCAKILEGHEEEIETACWSPDGKRIASGSGDKTLRIWDLEKNSCAIILQAHDEDIESVSWSPDGKSIVSCSPDGKIRIHKAKSGIRVLSFPE